MRLIRRIRLDPEPFNGFFRIIESFDMNTAIKRNRLAESLGIEYRFKQYVSELRGTLISAAVLEKLNTDRVDPRRL